jgi:hypothetical protein
MEKQPEQLDNIIATDALPTPAPTLYITDTVVPTITSLSSSSDVAASEATTLETIIPFRPSDSMDGQTAPEQGAVIALGVICGLMMFGILFFMTLYLSRNRHDSRNRTTNIRIIRRPRRPRTSSLPRGHGGGGHGRGGPEGAFQALEAAGQSPRAIAGMRGADPDELGGRYAGEMDANGMFEGVDAPLHPSYFQQGRLHPIALGVPNVVYGPQNTSQLDPAQSRGPGVNDSQVDGLLRGGLRGTQQPGRGGRAPGSHRSSRLSGRSWL